MQNRMPFSHPKNWSLPALHAWNFGGGPYRVGGTSLEGVRCLHSFIGTMAGRACFVADSKRRAREDGVLSKNLRPLIRGVCYVGKLRSTHMKQYVLISFHIYIPRRDPCCPVVWRRFCRCAYYFIRNNINWYEILFRHRFVFPPNIAWSSRSLQRVVRERKEATRQLLFSNPFGGFSADTRRLKVRSLVLSGARERRQMKRKRNTEERLLKNGMK